MGKTYQVARQYKGVLIFLIGILINIPVLVIGGVFHSAEKYLEIFKEIGNAFLVAGIITLFVDEITKREIIEVIKNMMSSVRNNEARRVVSALYKRDIPDHVWSHCEDLFQSQFSRHDHVVRYEIEEGVEELSGSDISVAKIVANYRFKVKNITSEDQVYRSKYRLEYDGIAVGSGSLKQLDFQKNGKNLRSYTEDEIQKLAVIEFSNGETEDPNNILPPTDKIKGSRPLYWLWSTEHTLAPGDVISVRQRVEYCRNIHDTDKYLVSTSADKLTVIITHSDIFNLQAFAVSPKEAPVDVGGKTTTVTIDDVMPYQGVVFSWNRRS